MQHNDTVNAPFDVGGEIEIAQTRRLKQQRIWMCLWQQTINVFYN